MARGIFMDAKAFFTVDKTQYRPGRFHPYVLDVFPSGEVRLHDEPQFCGGEELMSAYDGRLFKLIFTMKQDSMTITAGRKFFRENIDLFRALFAGWTIDADAEKGRLTAEAEEALQKLGYLAYALDPRD